MSRSSKPKPVVAEAAKPADTVAQKPETPAAASAGATHDPAKALPQVAQDTTGAAVAAAAPVDPHMPTGPGASPEDALAPDGTAPSPHAPQPPTAKGFVLRVKGPAKGRWRAGRHFGPEEVEIAAAELSEEEIARLNADPELSVLVVGET